MKRTLALIAALSVVALTVPVAAEQIKEIDQRDDVEATGKLLVFSWHPLAKNSPNGECIVLLGTGESATDLTVELSFGLFKNGAKMVTTSLTAEQIAKVRGGVGAKEATTLSCKIDDDQFAKAKEILELYGAQESFPDTANNVLLNVTSEIIRTAGLKMPYRSGLTGTQPMGYFVDLSKLNRGKKRDS